MALYECWHVEDIPGDDVELVAGYQDGRSGEPEPGANRSPAYHHGWWAGLSDRDYSKRPEWIPALAKELFAK